MAPTTVSLARLVPRLYDEAHSDYTGDWTKLLGILEAGINLILSGGTDAATSDDLTPVSVDAMADVWDPLRAEVRLLPYIAQRIGWDLDTSVSEALQRKVTALAGTLLREKGTTRGIIDALRLLLGIEATVFELWADAWVYGEDIYGEGTYLAPAQYAEGYARGTLTGVSASELADNDGLASAGWAATLEIQKTATGGGEAAYGFLMGVPKARLLNNLYFTLPKPSSPSVTFEFKVDDGFVAQAGRMIIDVTGAGDDAPDEVATSIAFAIEAARIAGDLSMSAAAIGVYVRLLEPSVGTAGNADIEGSAVEVLDAIGMTGGAAGESFVQVADHVVNLIGATSAEDVTKRTAYNLAWFNPDIEVTRFLTVISLRARSTGAAYDGDITGAAATVMSATGMTGGAESVNPLVLTFTVTFPRHLTDDELRIATAVIRFMKPAQTHEQIINPPATPIIPFRYGATAWLGQATLTAGHRSYSYPSGVHGDDPLGEVIGPTWRVALDAGGPVRTPRLIVGARYLVQVDDDAYVRQGNRQVEADSSDFAMGLLRDRIITPTGLTNCYVSALQLVANAGKYLTVTRLDGITL